MCQFLDHDVLKIINDIDESFVDNDNKPIILTFSQWAIIKNSILQTGCTLDEEDDDLNIAVNDLKEHIAKYDDEEK